MKLDRDRNSRTYLHVPFAEKNEAKSRGARWDRERGEWYAPPRTALASFGKWLAGTDRDAYLADEMQRQDRLERYQAWNDLEPRSSDPPTIADFAPSPIVLVRNGRCSMCDSDFSSEWCIKEQGMNVELRHLADLGGAIRPSEIRLLEAALASGFVPR